MKLLKDIQNTNDLVKLGLNKRKAKEMLHRIKLIAKDDTERFVAIKKAYCEVLRLGYLSKEYTTELQIQGINMPLTIATYMEVPVERVIEDIERRKLNSSNVEFVIRYLTPQVEMRKIKV